MAIMPLLSRTPVERPAQTTCPAALRVAILDGDRADAEVLQAFFRLIAMEASVVELGPAAVTAIRALAPSAIILDWDLPARQALEIFHEIRREMADVPVVFLTAGEPPLHLSARRCVAVRKPFGDFEALLCLAEIILNDIA